jgi:hypothetical protein
MDDGEFGSRVGAVRGGLARRRLPGQLRMMWRTQTAAARERTRTVASSTLRASDSEGET